MNTAENVTPITTVPTDAEVAELRDTYLMARKLFTDVETDRRWEILKLARAAYHAAVDARDLATINEARAAKAVQS